MDTSLSKTSCGKVRAASEQILDQVDIHNGQGTFKYPCGKVG